MRQKKVSSIGRVSVYFMYGCNHTFPENPDVASISDELLYDFRVGSVISVTIFWFTLAFVFGGLWRRFIPNIADSAEK